ncbi:terminase small subunit [Enterococcus plantarum]|uniref:Terminase n=1 Tax=Enterococcus plantarum TaxID=1077675 RepID=A0A2W3YUZ8_9ENTE|nr:terminase small subunit [Enterococcus plantarum]MBO0423846.1 terminase small subunit [Enterococcus plantarum]PZL71728.1 terminase [Enterococcus plantarum]
MEKWELAYEDYKQGMKYKDIAEKYEVSINTVKSWKSRKWNAPPDKEVATKKKKVAHKKKLQPVIENDDLTEQQKMFCLFYLQHFNATKAYQQAYQVDYRTAHANSYRLMAKDGIKIELHRLKAELQQDTFVDVKDLIQEYAKQAFADISDFTEFGQELVEFEDGEERPISFVRLKSSDEVDGSLIQEVKKGKDGVSVKLYDKQKAMSELMKYLGGDALRQAQITKMQSANETTETTEDKLDELLNKISGELNGTN